MSDDHYAPDVMDAFVSLQEGRYVAAFFHIDTIRDKRGKSPDVFGVAYSDDPELRHWTLKLRFRHYPPREEPFKRHYAIKYEGDEAGALRAIREPLRETAEEQGAPFEEVTVRVWGEDAMEVLEDQDWAHVTEDLTVLN